MPVISSLLMCHAPVIIPRVGREQSVECKATTLGMEQIAQHALNQNPDQIILISPHTPRLPDKFGILDQRISGSLSNFGHPNVKINLPTDHNLHREICLASNKYFETLPRIEVDHGAIVPLWFFQKYGWEGKTSVIGMPARIPFSNFYDAIVLLKSILAKDPQNFILIASGDLSHCVEAQSPIPYHPDGPEFDKKIRKLIKEGGLNHLRDLSPTLIQNAAEDCVETLSFVGILHEDDRPNSKIISYESPFGVGYCVALLNQVA